LIALADRLEARRVVEGRLGCANCRESYPIHAGVVDLRVARSSPLAISPDHAAGADEQGYRVAALLGSQPMGSKVLILEHESLRAQGVSDLLPDAMLVAGAADASHEVPEPIDDAAIGGPSRTLHGAVLPFATAGFRAIALLGSTSRSTLEEVKRVIAPGGRLVVDGGAPETAASLSDLGFDVLLDQDRTVVAAAPGRR